MSPFLWIRLSSLLVGLVALIGVVTFTIREQWLNSLIFVLVGFAAGSLLGGAMFHLLPASIPYLGYDPATKILLAGFVLFFIMERVLYWRHCHERDCDVHAFSYLVLFGDAIHNFIDGVIIAASYTSSIALGVTSTLAIVLHEIPQELGDFSVLVYGGFSKTKALIYNFLSQLTAILGALFGYYVFSHLPGLHNLHYYLLPFAAGGFLYIATSDLIPELHREQDLRRSVIALMFFLLGLFVMVVL